MMEESGAEEIGAMTLIMMGLDIISIPVAGMEETPGAASMAQAVNRSFQTILPKRSEMEGI